MTSTLSNFLAFTVGAAIGGVVTWKLIENRYKQIAQEEIDSMNEYYRNKYGVKADDESENEETTSDDAETDPDQTQMDIREYAKKLAKNKYTNYSAADKTESEEVDDVEKPYIIAPEELGELDGYETVTLYYHADGVLTDDQNEIVEDVDDAIGSDSLNHFGQYEPDSVCVRNDARRVDYEILYDPSSYSDSINKSPHLAED